jgi:hypothetical protein
VSIKYDRGMSERQWRSIFWKLLKMLMFIGSYLCIWIGENHLFHCAGIVQGFWAQLWNMSNTWTLTTLGSTATLSILWTMTLGKGVDIQKFDGLWIYVWCVSDPKHIWLLEIIWIILITSMNPKLENLLDTEAIHPISILYWSFYYGYLIYQGKNAQYNLDINLITSISKA